MLYCAAFFSFSNKSLGEATYRLFLLGSFFSMMLAPQGRWRIMAIMLVLSSIAIQLVSWAYSQAHHPEYAAPDPSIKRLTALLLFTVVAWTLYINKRPPWFLFLVFFIGTSLTPFTRGEGIEEFLGTRSSFGIRNAQHPAMMFSVAFLGLVVFGKRIFLNSPLKRSTTTILYILAVLYCVAILFVTNTRGVFLGLTIAFLLLFLIRFTSLIHHVRNRKWIIGAIAVATCIPLLVSSGHLTQRWAAESSDLRGIINGNLDEISTRSNIGIRVHSWVAAYNGFLQHPLLGWGPSGKKIVLLQSETLPNDIKERFGHLHNAYLEVLTNNGLLGFAFLVFVYVWIGRIIVSAGAALYVDIRIFAVTGCALWLVANCFESYMFYKSGIMTFGMVAGGLMSLALISREQVADASNVHQKLKP